MNGIATNELFLGSGILTITGNTLYINGSAMSGLSASTGQLTGTFYPLYNNPNYYVTSTGIETITGLKYFNYINPNYISGDVQFIDDTDNLCLYPSSRVLTDYNGNTSLDWNNLQLQNAGMTIIDWGNYIFYDGNYPDNTSIDFGNRTLNDNSSIISIDWQNKILTGDWQVQNLSLSGSKVITAIQTGIFYPSTNPSGFITGFNSGLYTLNANTGNFVTTGQTGAFGGGGSVNTGQLTGTFYPLNSNPSGYISTGISFSTQTYAAYICATSNQTIAGSTSDSPVTVSFDTVNFDIGGITNIGSNAIVPKVSGIYYLQAAVTLVPAAELRLYIFKNGSLLDNSYNVISSDISVQFLPVSLLIQCVSGDVITLEAGGPGGATIYNVDGRFSSYLALSLVNPTNQIVYNTTISGSGSYYPLSNNPSGYITGFNSGIYTLNTNTGSFITTGQTGVFGGNSLTDITDITASGRIGILQTHPQFTLDINGNIGNSNGNIPSSYIDLSNTYLRDGSAVISLIWNSRTLLDTSQSTSVDWGNRILTGNWKAQNLSLSGSSVVIASQTGNFYSNNNPNGYITGLNTGNFITSFQTGIFITTGQTGSFGGITPTGILTGVFYPLNTNPSGYISGFNSGLYTLNSSTGAFITTGQTGNFGGTTNTGQLTGAFYPLTGSRPSINYTTNIDWSASNSFYTTLTGNTTYTFSNSKDGQNIIVSVRNTGTNGFTGSWPNTVKWSYQIIPTQTSGNFTDIYNFVNFTGVVFGSVIQGF
jgi:hypothetical protein